MNAKMRALPLSLVGRRASLLASMMLVASNAHAQIQNIIVNPCNNVDTKYSAAPSDVVSTTIEVLGGSGTIEWGFNSIETGCTSLTETSIRCAEMTVTIPAGAVPASEKVTIAGSPTVLGEGRFSLIATQGGNSCVGKYLLRVTSAGGGWGDPHITTVDGVHYDFQSAGEFVSLREKGLELQTRQRAVPTTSIPSANAYTGLATCVSIYTAVAVRIGSNRVTIQPNIDGRPDPSSMQLRVNGKLVTLPSQGITLTAGGGDQGSARAVAAPTAPQIEGRVLRAANNAIEIRDSRGTQIVVTPAFWNSQQTWYLNVNVYQTSATDGIMGRIAPKSWLPALPDGTSLGPKPQALDQRYQDLYEKFADAWRVTDATSLFDYAPGTSTATFTIDEWPRYSPQSCALQGQPSAPPATPQVAAQACSGVTDPDQKADCIFDVTFTGHTGFAQSYVAMQRFEPNGPGWQPPLSARPKRFPWWWILLAIAAAALAAAAAKLAP